ncbi:MAG: hypothetical protein ACOCZB_06330 [Spirochaetota bacterium]
MNKKANTILFMIAATVVNVVLMILILVGLMVLYAWVAPGGFASQVGQIAGIVIFLAAIGLTYFIYHRLIRWISSKWNLEEYFAPIFGKKGGDGAKPNE